MKQNLKRMLLCVALVGLSFTAKPDATMYDWVPVGDGTTVVSNPLGDDTFVTTGGVYLGNDILAIDSPSADYNRAFSATATRYILNVYNKVYDKAPNLGGTVVAGLDPVPLKVNGIVRLEAREHDMIINIKDDVIIEPLYEKLPVESEWEGSIHDNSMIYFDTRPICSPCQDVDQTCRKIMINVDHNLEFRSKTVELRDTEETFVDYSDLIIAFRGRGTVTFNMKDGTYVKFMGQTDESHPYVYVHDANGNLIREVGPSEDNMPSNLAGGVQVFILMDQELEDVTSCKNKVIFQRQSIDKVPCGDSNCKRLLVEVGPNSTISYLSTNLTGETQECTSGPCELCGGYGAMAFDTSNNGSGRMVLFIDGAYKYDKTTDELSKFQFNDGGVIVAGHYVSSFEADVICGEGHSAVGFDYSKPAGIRAIMRVVDNKLYDSLSEDPTVDQRRGLLLVNHAQSHGKLASDPYWDLYSPEAEGYLGVLWAYSKPENYEKSVRKGFVLGVNGTLDIYHNVFVDYVAGSINETDPLAEYDFGTPDFGGNLGVLKKRNPAALIADGLDVALFTSGNPFRTPSISPFIAANPFVRTNPARAEIQLRGSGSLYMRDSASTHYGFLYNLFDYSGAYTTPLNDPDLDWTLSLALGTGTYDGYQLSPNANTVQDGEGEHVLDVEGELAGRSIANNTAYDLTTNQPREYTTIVEKSGVLNAATLLLNYKGQEIYGYTTYACDDPGTVICRPLAVGGEYTRYNSPTLFFNNNALLFETTLRHSDVTKWIDGMPNLLSEPGMTGGERLWFNVSVSEDNLDNRKADPNRYRFPELQLYNATLELQESLCAGGMRFVTKDLFGDPTSDNTSEIQFFDHGKELDTRLTGHGRIFLLGGSNNHMADGSNNYVTESAFVNIFKHNAPAIGPDLQSARVTLSLINGDQFPSQCENAAARAITTPDETLKDSQRAHHLVMISQPWPLEKTLDKRYPKCNISVGWFDSVVEDDPVQGTNAPHGDGGAFPYSLPYAGNGGELMPTAEPLIAPNGVFVSVPFSLDALNTLKTPPATLSIDGKIICFGSFDKDGNSIKRPLKEGQYEDNNDGVVYVKHGGKITVTRPDCSADIEARCTCNTMAYQTVFSTLLAQRMWNDYNLDGDARVCWLSGIIDLPHNQVIFDTKYAVQPYNLNSVMFEARADQTDGYVRVGSFMDERSPQFDKPGVEEMLFGWYWRDYPIYDKDSIDALPKTIKQPVVDMTRWLATREVESINTPAPRPYHMLYVGPGDDITQIKVSGATMSDPFVLDVSGDVNRPIPARVREFVSVKSEHPIIPDHFISEGAHAVLFVEYGGRIGLGTLDWDEDSVNAWNLLGKEYVTICPLGDGIVDVNSNLLITDRQALLATDKFGADGVNRLIFYSEAPCEIRVPAHGEFDLSSFGHGTYRQEIEFAGNIKLVLEEGAILRFPVLGTHTVDDQEVADAGVVLYFNDNAQLVFEGSQSPRFVPFTDAYGAHAGPGGTSDDARIKILGEGEIWANKNAKILVNDDVFVGVETDKLTPATDLTIGLQRHAAMFIGDETVAGGAFQVGNPTEQKACHEGARDPYINFKLIINGPDARFQIDREGFFGLATGIVNKGSAINGDALQSNNPIVNSQGNAVLYNGLPQFNPDKNPYHGGWQVYRLFNVYGVEIEIREGLFVHRNIADGRNNALTNTPAYTLPYYGNNASLMAIGPASSFTWKQNATTKAKVFGGGNIMHMPEEHYKGGPNDPIFVNIWDYAGPLINHEAYSVLASGNMIFDRKGDYAYAATNYGDSGWSFRINGNLPNANGVFFYSLLATKAFKQQNQKKVAIAGTEYGDLYVYLNKSCKYGNLDDLYSVYRNPITESIAINGGTVEQAVALGTMGAAGDCNGNPVSFTVIK